MELYQKSLSNKGWIPLWLPSLSGDLPNEKLIRGIELGDVGTLNSLGGFDFAFNIFRSSDDGLNFYGAPDGHVSPDWSGHIWSTKEYHSPGHIEKSGSHRANAFNARVTSIFLCGAGVFAGSEMENSASCIFPAGASLEELRNILQVKAYVDANQAQWLRFIYKTLGRRGKAVFVKGRIMTSECQQEVNSGSAWSAGASASADTGLAGAHLNFGITSNVSGSCITRIVPKDEFGSLNKCAFMETIPLRRRPFLRRRTTSDMVGLTPSALPSAAIQPRAVTIPSINLVADATTTHPEPRPLAMTGHIASSAPEAENPAFNSGSRNRSPRDTLSGNTYAEPLSLTPHIPSLSGLEGILPSPTLSSHSFEHFAPRHGDLEKAVALPHSSEQGGERRGKSRNSTSDGSTEAHPRLPSVPAFPTQTYMSAQSSDIPSINVTVTPDLPPLSRPPSKGDSHPSAINVAVSQPDSGQQTKHTRSPSDPAFLVPGKPYVDSDASSNDAPPSPTLSSQSSVHFATSVALRENKPEEGTGMISLNLLPPSSYDTKHRRKRISATFTSPGEFHNSVDGTEPDHGGLFALRHAVPSATSAIVESPTETHVDGGSRMPQARSDGTDFEVLGKGKWAGSGKSSDEDEDDEDLEVTPKRRCVDLIQDEDIDPTPFAFKPYELASMLDPKNLELLESLGGVKALMSGLGTHQTMGLSKKSFVRSDTFKAREAEQEVLTGKRPKAGAGYRASQPHGLETSDSDVPRIGVTTPERKTKGPNDGEEDPAFSATLDERKRIYGANLLPRRASKSLLQLMWTALKDKVLVLLSIAAVISLALGLFQDFGTPRDPGEAPVDWVEGVAIMVAILIVVVIGSVNDWQKERQFRSLDDKKEERRLKVIRDGVEKIIDVKEVVVGDIALMEPGEIIPCDGVFLSGHNLKCDESGATGESDAIKKVSYDDCLALRQKNKDAYGSDDIFQTGLESAGGHTDCFIVSGSKVLEGVGSYVVVAVGTKSFNGRIMMALRGDTENTPLQSKLNNLAELIAKLGSAAGLALVTALMIRFFVQLGTGGPPRNPNQKGIALVNILIIAVTLIVVAVPEGLPLAITLTLAFATKRMTYEKLLVHVLGSCETMANASVVCTDKTGTLTQNVMTVVAGSIGVHAKFVRNLEQNEARTNADEEGANAETGKIGEKDVVAPDAAGKRKHPDDFTLDQANINDVLSPQLRDLFNSAITVNSTAFEDTDPDSGEVVFVGSKTEIALLKFAKELGWNNYKETRSAAEVVQVIPFSSERKAMGVVVKLPGGKFRLHLKGASEILTKKCTRHVVVRRNAKNWGKESDPVETAAIDDLASDNISRTIICYANQTLRTIGLCYRDFDSWPPAGMRYSSVDDVDYNDLARDLTLIGITGIEDPLRDGVRDAVAKCHKAGVTVKMCTGDNVLTARSIAIQCGIYTPGGIIMEGPVFRRLDRVQMAHVVPRLQVLARSSPEDKKILVETLKDLGEIVGVTGDGTIDGPALKSANVGFSMRIAGTEVAKETSNTILMDDNFSSIVKAIMWGRCVNDAVRKFLQFQISTNVTAVVITFVSAVASDQEESVLSAVQLLWINIIMDTFAALALATDSATEALLDRKPDRKTAPLFSVHMYKQILWQSIYQIIIILTFHFAGRQILGFEAHPTDSSVANKHDRIVQTLIFNAFVFAQIFNSVNCRRLDNKLNIFEGITKNLGFIVVTFAKIVVQILMIFVGGAALHMTCIGSRDWGIALALAVVSILPYALVRIIPGRPFETLSILLRLSPTPNLPPTDAPKKDPAWNPVVDTLRDNLGMFSKIRGGRLRSSSFVLKSRQSRPNDASVEKLTYRIVYHKVGS